MHLDLMEAVSLRERSPMEDHSKAQRYFGMPQSDSSSRQERLAASFNKREGSPRESTYRQIAYNEYLTQAFGLLGKENARPYRHQRNKPSTATESDDAESMEVPLSIASKDRRPKIQLTIPGKRPYSYSHISQQQSAKDRKARRTPDLSSGSSPPSSSSHHRAFSDEVNPARLSVVSPLSVVEMPKPRRPFSTLSLESMTADMSKSAPPPKLEKANIIDSSDDTSGQDDRSSNYSPRSSMSSLTSDPGITKPIEQKHSSVAFSIMSPTAAGVFDAMDLAPKPPKNPRAMKSTTALAHRVNKNKPLPPEPELEEVRPLNTPGQPFSRSNSQKRRQNAPTPLNISRHSTVATPSRRVSLRSKYTPADLDDLDAAFKKPSAPSLEPSIYSRRFESQTLSQAELALEAHLGTIGEDTQFESQGVADVADPLQIKRGPNRFEPTRCAPTPPPRSETPSERSAPRKRLIKRSASHVASQMRAESMKSRDSSTSLKISAPMPGSSWKAERILGKSESGEIMERQASEESNWSSSDSAQPYSSPILSATDDSQTPDSEFSSVPDAAFEEVRKRLELLSAKNEESSQIFFALHESDDSSDRAYADECRETAHEFSDAQQEAQTFETGHVPITIRLDPVIEETRSQIEPVSPEDESDIHPLERRGRINDTPVRSLGSIAMSEIPELYASLPSPSDIPPVPALPSTSVRESLSPEELERIISADAAEKVLLRILQNLDNLQDLFACATVSRGFYRTFKRHELPLMKNALYAMSPAAWELREMSQPYNGLIEPESSPTSPRSPMIGYTPSLYLQHYMRDMYTMIALKSMILIHCESFLRADTITALAGGETERASQIDDAFWRVWTFCQVFGCGSNREDDIVGQMDWLRGGQMARQQRRRAGSLAAEIENSILYSPPTSFGRGNHNGLSAEDLYDMTEIWTCLGVLVRGFQGKRQEARDFGVFENASIAAGDVEKEDAVLGKSSHN